MVMRNRHEEPGWWEELPPDVRSRFGAPTFDDSAPTTTAATESPFPARLGLFRETSLLAAMFLVVAIANVLLLLLVLAFVDGVAVPMPWQGR